MYHRIDEPNITSPWSCSKCGSPLVEKLGPYGFFLVCEKYCGFTKSYTKTITVNKKCPKCKGSGLIPFVKGGRLIPYTFEDCDCKTEAKETYYPACPSDFDFPMSAAFRAWTYQYSGANDHGGSATQVEPIAEVENRLNNLEALSAELGSVPRLYEGKIKELTALVYSLQNKIKNRPPGNKSNQVKNGHDNREDITDRLYQ